MSNTTNFQKEPSVKAILADEAFQRLIIRDGQSQQGIEDMMFQVAQQRSAQGWSR